MGAVTYPNPDVERYLEAHFIPVKFNVVEQPEMMDRFNSVWTPTLIVQDVEEREHRRAEGYHDPRRFLGEMSLAWPKAAINRRDFVTARERVEKVLNMTHGDPAREPEALYWAAVARYKASNDAKWLIEGWNHLLDDFPRSEWAQRAEFIRS